MSRNSRRSWILESTPETEFRILLQWNLDSGFQLLVGLRIPEPRIPDSTSKSSQLPESGFPYVGRKTI